MATILANPIWEQRTAQAGQAAGIPPEFLASFYRQMALESGNFDPSIISGQQASPAGARGLAQFMPSAMHDFPHDPTNPMDSLNAGAKYMSSLYHRLGNWGQAQAAYNMGPGNLQKFQAGQMSLPAETANYLDATGSTQSFTGSAPTLPVVDVQSTFPSLSGYLGNAMQHLNDNTAEVVGNYQAQAVAANTAQQQAMQQMTDAAAQPAPTNDPKAEFITNLMGGISQALSPRMGGQQVAANTLESRLAGIREQRRQSMEVLAQKYQAAASEATRAGETAKSAQFMAKRDNLLKDMEMHLQTYGAETDRTTANAHQLSAQADLVRALQGGSGATIDRSLLTEGMQSFQTTIATIDQALARTGKDQPKGKTLMNLLRTKANAQATMNAAYVNFQKTGQMGDLKTIDVADQHVADTIAGAQAEHRTLAQTLQGIDRLKGNDQEWQLGHEGITKDEMKWKITLAWPKDAKANGPGAQGPAQDAISPGLNQDLTVASRFLGPLMQRETGLDTIMPAAEKMKAMLGRGMNPAMVLQIMRALMGGGQISPDSTRAQ
jgi:hypothetical protein